MKKLCLLTILFVMVAGYAVPVLADDEPAKYNFASAQGASNLQIVPGDQGQGDIYFYNVDGNRITHVSLQVSGVPDGWEVEIEPPLADVQVLVNDIPVTVTENLYVEPSELLSEEPESVPDGLVSIRIPERGYTLGKQAQIMVRVPEGVPFGTTGVINISAEAVWLGQSGSAAMKQARDFEFTVTVISGKTGYSEEVVGPAATTDTGAGDETTGTTGSGIPFWVWIIVGVAAVGILFLFFRRRHD